MAFHYYLFHKPFGCVTARRDERYPTVMDWFRALDNPDLSPVGRLDRETEGLLLITDDGMFNRALTRPEFHKEKVYEFLVLGDLTEDKRQALEAGVLLNGEDTPTAPARITVTGKSTLGAVLPALHPEIQEKSRHNPMDRPVTFGSITITEGRNRQIRKMCEALGLEVARLKRTAIGPVKLGMLQQGKWRDLTPQEVASLKRASK